MAQGANKVFFGYFVVFALIVAICIPLSLGINCAGIFYTALSNELGVSSGVLSYYTSFLWGAGLLTLPFMGKMLDKLDARICVAGSCALISLDFVWLSFVSSLWQYFAGAFVMGFGVTMLNLMAPSTLVNRWFHKRAGFFVGLIMAFAGVGGFLFSTIGGSLILSIGWSHTYLVFAALSALTVPICIICIRSFPKDKGLEPYGADETDSKTQNVTNPDQTGMSKAAYDKKAFHSRVFLLLLVLCFLMNFCMYTYYIIPSYVDSLALSRTWPLLGAMAGSCAMGGQVVTKLGMGALSDRRPYLGTMVCFGFGILGVLTLCFGGAFSALIFAGAVGYGFFHGTTNVMMPVFTERAFGNYDYAKIYSRISMASCAASVTNGFIFGTIIHITGSYQIVLVAIACLMALAAFVVLALRHRDSQFGEKKKASGAKK